MGPKGELERVEGNESTSEKEVGVSSNEWRGTARAISMFLSRKWYILFSVGTSNCPLFMQPKSC